ncbi:MAG: divergent polysaccharide deacetylase family protein [Candidatus Schmidhempelia sp.]|nr:divergent polysaccharide deacetylase family protein [Candidatus Schmidhempelia sp.]
MSRLLTFIIFSMMILPVSAARLAIVIDDLGYRKEIEKKIIQLSPKITVAVLPNSPNAKYMAMYANSYGNQVMIHLPMAPIHLTGLEKDTLFPNMSQTEVTRIIDEAITKVPYAVGINNHMGSRMTSSLPGMKKVMASLSKYTLFFLDSRTIATTCVKEAADSYQINVLSRDIFLDDTISEADIAAQFDIAIQLARKNGYAIAIGHPHEQTFNVLYQKLLQLPDDIQLITPSELLQPSQHSPTVGQVWKFLVSDIKVLIDNWNFQLKNRNISNKFYY